MRAAPAELAVDESGVEVGDLAAEGGDGVGTSNATLEWTVSACHVPAGSDCLVSLMVLVMGSSS